MGGVGSYLSRPEIETTTNVGGDDRLTFYSCAMQGWRTTMEDAHSACLDIGDSTSYFAVYDGHGGSAISEYCSQVMHPCIVRQPTFLTNLGDALRSAFLEIDSFIITKAGQEDILRKLVPAEVQQELQEELKALKEEQEEHDKLNPESPGSPGRRSKPPLIADRRAAAKVTNGLKLIEVNDDDDEKDAHVHSKGDDTAMTEPTETAKTEEADDEFKPSGLYAFHQGTTAVAAAIRGTQLVVANSGDSRCILSRSRRAIEMSKDHNPTDEEELERIREAGGFVQCGRVNGNLNLSRAIGDHQFKRNLKAPPEKQVITAYPDIRTMELQPEDEFIFLACDGIWNCLTSQQVVDFIWDRLDRRESPQAALEALFMQSLAKDTNNDGTGCDNMTAVLVLLHLHGTKDPLKPQLEREISTDSSSTSSSSSSSSDIELVRTKDKNRRPSEPDNPVSQRARFS